MKKEVVRRNCNSFFLNVFSLKELNSAMAGQVDPFVVFK